MKKQSLLKFINIILLIAFFLVALSMILYRWGSGSLQGSEMIYEIHETSGMIFFFIAILHLIMNWTWIRNNYLKKRK